MNLKHYRTLTVEKKDGWWDTEMEIRRDGIRIGSILGYFFSWKTKIELNGRHFEIRNFEIKEDGNSVCRVITRYSLTLGEAPFFKVLSDQVHRKEYGLTENLLIFGGDLLCEDRLVCSYRSESLNGFIAKYDPKVPEINVLLGGLYLKSS